MTEHARRVAPGRPQPAVDAGPSPAVPVRGATPAIRPPLEVRLDDVVTLRRVHPCGGRDWTVIRLGADIGLRCTTCARRVLLERSLLERRIASFASRGPGPRAAATAPSHDPGAPGGEP